MTTDADRAERETLAERVRQGGVRVKDADLDVVLPIFLENRAGLERLRALLGETVEPAVTFPLRVARNDR